MYSKVIGRFDPPSGVVGENYAKSSHHEYDAHQWAYQLTMHRSVPSTAAKGGHFFIAEYGVLIRVATVHFLYLESGTHAWNHTRKKATCVEY